MAHDFVRNSGLTRAVTDVLADLSDLAQKELRLAKAEVTEKVAHRLRAGVWMAVAALFGLIALLLVVEAAALALASFAGIALHWACLLVAIVLAAVGAVAFYYARSVMQEELLPTRTARQITNDIRTVKEQLT